MSTVNGELVTVIMPNYNNSNYVLQSIRSVLNQSYRNIELIVIDDSSTDDSFEKIKNSIKDLRLKLLRNERNCGVSFSRNVGLKTATGRYISFIDSDDFWLENKLQDQINFLKEKACNFCYSSVQFVDDKDFIINNYLVPSEVNYAKLLYKNFVPTITILYDRIELDPENNFHFEEIRHEDYKFVLGMSKLKTFKGVGIRNILASYRISNSSLSSNKLRSIFWHYKVLRSENISHVKILFRLLPFYALYGFRKYYFKLTI